LKTNSDKLAPTRIWPGVADRFVPLGNSKRYLLRRNDLVELPILKQSGLQMQQT